MTCLSVNFSIIVKRAKKKKLNKTKWSFVWKGEKRESRMKKRGKEIKMNASESERFSGNKSESENEGENERLKKL